jgi:short-subunit dehydrogenase
MLRYDVNLPLKIVALLLQPLFYIASFIISIFFMKDVDNPDSIRAPQQPRIIVITGASQGLFHNFSFSLLFVFMITGIGEALVKYYYNNCPSCQTIVLISRSKEKLETLKNSLNPIDETKQIVIHPCDVTNTIEMDRILLDVYHTYGHIDILIANAGLNYHQVLLTNTFEKTVRSVFNTNVIGVVNSIMPLIDSKSVSQIAIISSQTAYAPILAPFYGTTKQCILSFGLELRRFLAKDKIAVNVACPGLVLTPMLNELKESVRRHGMSSDEAARLIVQGLLRNQAEIVFPAGTGIFQYALSYLPLSIAEPISFFVHHME